MITAALVNFINTKDISQPANYQYLKDNVDVDEFINYQIAQIYSSNTDWPGNNLKYWKPKREGGKWRWILFDMDFGFGLYGSRSQPQYPYLCPGNQWTGLAQSALVDPVVQKADHE